MGQALARFRNIVWSSGWEMPVSRGVAPAVCTIRTVPHLDHLETHGDLTLIEEGNGELVIRDCLLETPHLNEDLTWSLPILDRRWRNRFGEIDGHYNIKRPDKTFIRERTPQELVALCLTAMGERQGRWDIGRLPNFARPEVEWDNDNPADALDQLCAELGCDVTLDYFQDMYVIWPVGQGVDLPDGPTASRAAGLSATAKPDEIKALSAHIMYQVRFACEAVARDVDGRIKPLAECSYAPLDDDDPEGFSNIDDEQTYSERGERKKVRDLAREWAHHAFRIIGVVKSGQIIRHSSGATVETLPTDGWSPEALKGSDNEPRSFADLKLLDHRAEQYIDEDDTPGSVGAERKINKEPTVFARWYDSENDATPQIPTQYRGGAQVDTRLGLVRTSNPLYLFEAVSATEVKVQPAEVFVDVAFYAGHDGHLVRKVKRFETGERNNTGARILKHEDVEVREIQSYEFRGVGSSSNGSYQVALDQTSVEPVDWQQQLQYYIDAVLPEYDPLPSYTRHYKRLMRIVPDGRIRQVSWSGGGGDSPSTRVSLNTDHDDWTPTVEEDRRKRAADKAAKNGQNNRVLQRREARV
jgi:hypothetical protein